VKKKNESATKMAKAIATMRESGLKVTDETQKGGSIGITGVHDRRKDALNCESRQRMLRPLQRCPASGSGSDWISTGTMLSRQIL
jgi:hypothetical protein